MAKNPAHVPRVAPIRTTAMVAMAHAFLMRANASTIIQVTMSMRTTALLAMAYTAISGVSVRTRGRRATLESEMRNTARYGSEKLKLRGSAIRPKRQARAIIMIMASAIACVWANKPLPIEFIPAFK